MGDRHAQAGDVTQAESLYHQALARDPDDIITLHRLGHLATRTGRIDEARAFFSRAIAINRKVPELHMGLAAACHAAGRLEEAASHCAEAARVRPDYAEAHLEQGNVWIRLRAEGGEEAQRLNGHWQSWTYQVGVWKLKAFAPRLDDLKPQPAAAAAPAAPKP